MGQMQEKASLSCPQICKQDRAGAQSHIISQKAIWKNAFGRGH